MRSPVTVQVSMAAAGPSPWLPLDTNQRPFQATLDFSLDSGSSGTVTGQVTDDNPNDFNNAIQRGGLAITRAGTVATISTALPHGLSAGDSVVVIGSGDANLDGTFQVASATANALTYAVANTGALKGTGNEKVAFLRVISITGLTTVTARTQTVLNQPTRAVRLMVTVAGAGIGRLSASQGYGRG